MATKYLVKKIETCPACEGRKIVQHPAWAEYWKENADKPVMTPAEDRQWFIDHGWGYREIPPEEECCGECDGNGEIVSEVDLLVVLSEVMAKA